MNKENPENNTIQDSGDTIEKNAAALKHSSIRYYVSENMLNAEFISNSLVHPLSKNAITQLLESSGFGKHHLEDDTLNEFIEYSSSNINKVITLEIHTDANFDLAIADDKMSATITVTFAKFGRDLTYQEVLESALESGISSDHIDTKILSETISKSNAMQHKNTVEKEANRVEESITIIFATGINPINGEDSIFEVLFNTKSEKSPRRAIDGHIDHYETHDYITVDEGQSVMRRIKHTKGTEGENILGEKIASENGNVIKFELDKTVRIDSNNPNLLIASKKGHPVASKTGVHIDDTLTIKDANLRSGNIHFDGSVEITGEVLPNVVIEATGDIFVRGMVENASLIAGNNITIGAGVLSSKLFDHHDDSMPECSIVAEGSIILKYCNSIVAKAKKDILVETYSMHSHLNAGRHLIFGHNNGKGVVIGGNNYGQSTVEANLIGSEAYVKTKIACGSLREINQQHKKSLGILSRTKSEKILLEKVLEEIKRKGTPTTVGKVILQKAKKLNDEINVLRNSIPLLEEKIIAIKKRLKNSLNAEITAHKNLYPNVHLMVNDIKATNNRERGQTHISCDDYQLHFN